MAKFISAETRRKIAASRLGKKHSAETLRKMSEAKKGKAPPNKGNPAWNKGIKTLEETKKKAVATRRKNGSYVAWNKGQHMKHSGSFKTGEQHHQWKGGITPEVKRLRNSREYAIWRTAVFERDDYTCRFCGVRGGKLNADHIKPFALFPELRFAIDNGRTLCVECHRNTETYGGRIG